jgi:hypothetical protein
MDKVVHSKRPRKRGMKKNTTQEGCLLFFLLYQAVPLCLRGPLWSIHFARQRLLITDGRHLRRS